MTGLPKQGRVSALGLALVRVSTGSQDLLSQRKSIEAAAAERGIQIVDWIELQGYSASGGAQEPAVREAIGRISRGDASMLIVTDSSRLDRREDLDAQAEILLAIRAAGGDVLSLSEPQFGKTDFAGRVVTLVLQQANAEKSRVVKDTTYRGMSVVRENGAHTGPLPAFWGTEGKRYNKQAVCTDPAAVVDIYERVANGESLASIGRSYHMWPNSVKTLVVFAPNHTGVEECSHTYQGETETWTHTVSAVVDSALWWRANRILAANATDARGNKGGRPIALPSNWISGILDCPACAGKLFVNTGLTPAGNPRTPKLRCGGHARTRLACGVFTGIDARPIIETISQFFDSDDSPILAFQRVAGNAHELDAMQAELRKVQARLSATEDDDALDALVAERKAIKARIEGFAVVPDRYDYAPTGQTVAQMWGGADDTVRRGTVRAVRTSWGLSLASQDGEWGVVFGAADDADATATGTDRDGAHGIVDLGNGVCFRVRE
ncbi:recombinase family protein [Cryptosporangium sp. NPDC051539]|uniref:recombinase family protein n=1 Tax=Cryptosporangium sp. NPDC051539 TaxID=3363962 RepID=UPI0037BC1D32